MTKNKPTYRQHRKPEPVFRETMPIPLGPPPSATSANVSKSMKSNRAKDTKPELLLRKTLWNTGIRGYRLNWKKAPGRPDICFPGRKIAIFVNGCYWHRCPTCNLPLPKSNTEFWKNKFERNVARDRMKKDRLEDAGWKVYVYWECAIKDSPEDIAQKIKKELE